MNLLKYISIKKKIKRVLPWYLTETIIFVKHFKSRISNHNQYIKYIKNKSGLEIGGPSTVFKGALPLYPQALTVDGVNFASDTVWEGEINRGRRYNYYANKMGLQFVADATDLSQLANESYDFILSSNCIEHIANPVKAIFEWKRVLKSGGALVLVAPNKKSNFDHRRDITKFEHIIEDFNNEIEEDDLSHLEEILSCHDLTRDPRAGLILDFEERSRRNFLNRTLHHHVFSLELLVKILEYCDFDVVATTDTKSDMFILATKLN